ncbi:MAG: FxsA family protein [Magnetospirillum sp.]|nr:FxsA family protein [Magnetospirillum sp.]
MAWLVLVAILAFPVIEITLFVQSATTFGVLPTIAAAILAGMVGMAVLRRQGLATALAVRAQLDHGELPLAEAFDGLCLAVAGGLLLLPGFFSDVLALLLLLPPVRALLRRWLAARVNVATPQNGGPLVIEGEFREVPPDRPVVPHDDP